MKSRLAMMAMLVTGLLMSGTGATLAVSGSTSNSSDAQYVPVQPVVTPTPTPAAPATPTPAPPISNQQVPAPPAQNQVLPAPPTSGGPPSSGPSSGTKGETNDSPPSTPSTPSTTPKSQTKPAATAPATREQGAQPTAQVAASTSSSLPFTGFAAIPILLGGIALMAGGLVMRRRTAA